MEPACLIQRAAINYLKPSPAMYLTERATITLCIGNWKFRKDKFSPQIGLAGWPNAKVTGWSMENICFNRKFQSQEKTKTKIFFFIIILATLSYAHWNALWVRQSLRIQKVELVCTQLFELKLSIWNACTDSPSFTEIHIKLTNSYSKASLDL